jgi:hydroxyethylthiazole kinase-like uncharacterized protein yjeF
MQRYPGVVPLYTAVEMRTIDRLTVDEVGLPAAVLMERAGMGAAGEILQWFPDHRRIAVVCGSGNNGGDGFVVARHLAATGRQVDVLLVEAESKLRREPAQFLEVLKRLGIPSERVNITAWSSRLAQYDLVVDALLGTGASGAPRPNIEPVITAINTCMLPVVALDVPSGVDASTGAVHGVAVQADLTLTFHGPKVGLAVAPGRFHAGRVKALDIGIPAQVDGEVGQGLATDSILRIVPPVPRWGSKYDAGAVLCIGGATSMAGAVSLCSQATLRAGAGITWAVVPDSIAHALDVAIPEVQFRGAISDATGRLTVAAAEGLEPIVAKADSVVVGPGIGDGDQVRALVRWSLTAAPAMVLDAQGIVACAGDPEVIAMRADRPTLITPHAGELAQLVAWSSKDVQAARLDAAREAAQRTRATVLLKGEDTIICEPSGDYIVARSHTAMATAGTGDVLAGVCGAFLAKGMPPLLAGAAATVACAAAAERAARHRSVAGVIARDLVEMLPAAIDRGSTDEVSA